jgi:hypothetical protein
MKPNLKIAAGFEYTGKTDEVQDLPAPAHESWRQLKNSVHGLPSIVAKFNKANDFKTAGQSEKARAIAGCKVVVQMISGDKGSSVQHALVAGEALTLMREHLLDAQVYRATLEEIGLPRTSARRLIDLFIYVQNRGGATGGPPVDKYPITVIQELAAPNIPAEVLAAFEKKMALGERVTKRDISQAIRAHKAPQVQKISPTSTLKGQLQKFKEWASDRDLDDPEVVEMIAYMRAFLEKL